MFADFLFLSLMIENDGNTNFVVPFCSPSEKKSFAFPGDRNLYLALKQHFLHTILALIFCLRNCTSSKNAVAINDDAASHSAYFAKKEKQRKYFRLNRLFSWK